MSASARLASLPFGLIGALLFLNVYAPQSLLPVLARDFGVSAAEVGTVAACGVFLAQAAALSVVQQSITGGRSSANGLYNLAYYGGASAASVLAGAAYDWRGWNAVAALCMVAMLAAGGVGRRAWAKL